MFIELNYIYLTKFNSSHYFVFAVVIELFLGVDIFIQENRLHILCVFNLCDSPCILENAYRERERGAKGDWEETLGSEVVEFA